MTCECGAPRVVARGLCNACYLAQRKQQRRTGTWQVSYVDAWPAVEHLERLTAAGVSKQQIVRLTGLHHTTIYHLQPGTRVHRKTVATILSVEPPSAAHAVVQDGAFVPGTGTARRLQALCALGWPSGLLADRLGLASAHGHVAELTRGEHDRVQASTARRVESLYDQLSMTVGPSQRVRDESQRKGWAPPMAWDDTCLCRLEWEPCGCSFIDDPTARPKGVLQGRLPRIPFPQRYLELRALGYADEDVIAWRMGITRRSLDRMLAPSRHGSEVDEDAERNVLQCTPSA